MPIPVDYNAPSQSSSNSSSSSSSSSTCSASPNTNSAAYSTTGFTASLSATSLFALPPSVSPASPNAAASNSSSSSSSSSPPPSCPDFSSNPIRYATGEIRTVPKELMSKGYGQDWGHTRSFSNRLTSSSSVTSSNLNGNNWFIKEIPQLLLDAIGNIAVTGIINDALWFKLTSNTTPTYAGMFFIAETLTEDTVNKVCIFTDTQGQVTKFYSFDGTINAALRGQLKSITDPYGTTYTPAYNAGNQITSLAFGGSPTSNFNYTYITSGANSGKLQTVLQMRGTTNVRQVNYLYYDGTNANGNAGDLEKSTVQQWNGSSWDTLGNTYSVPERRERRFKPRGNGLYLCVLQRHGARPAAHHHLALHRERPERLRHGQQPRRTV